MNKAAAVIEWLNATQEDDRFDRFVLRLSDSQARIFRNASDVWDTIEESGKKAKIEALPAEGKPFSTKSYTPPRNKAEPTRALSTADRQLADMLRVERLNSKGLHDLVMQQSRLIMASFDKQQQRMIELQEVATDAQVGMVSAMQDRKEPIDLEAIIPLVATVIQGKQQGGLESLVREVRSLPQEKKAEIAMAAASSLTAFLKANPNVMVSIMAQLSTLGNDDE